MELDKRIKNIDDIQTIISNNCDSIGCNGFFFDNFVQAKVLTKTHYGTLVDISVVGNDDHCFKARDENGRDFIGYYRFFIPEDVLKPVEKKYRQFTIEEFQSNFKIGMPIRFRAKNTSNTPYLLILNGYIPSLTNAIGTWILFGDVRFSLEDLFKNYEWQEWQEPYTENYKPFGVCDGE